MAVPNNCVCFSSVYSYLDDINDIKTQTKLIKNVFYLPLEASLKAELILKIYFLLKDTVAVVEQNASYFLSGNSREIEIYAGKNCVHHVRACHQFLAGKNKYNPKKFK